MVFASAHNNLKDQHFNTIFALAAMIIVVLPVLIIIQDSANIVLMKEQSLIKEYAHAHKAKSCLLMDTVQTALFMGV